MAKGSRRAAALLLTFVMVLALASVPAFAKTKTIKMKSAEYTKEGKDIAKTAKKVKKGTYIIKPSKKDGGYLKFTAPKTKKYKITISHYHTDKFYSNGYWNIMTNSGKENEYYPKKVKTQGGSNSSLYICSDSNTTGKKSYRFLRSRYGKLKIKKGETIYIYLKYVDGTVKLNIK